MPITQNVNYWFSSCNILVQNGLFIKHGFHHILFSFYMYNYKYQNGNYSIPEYKRMHRQQFWPVQSWNCCFNSLFSEIMWGDCTFFSSKSIMKQLKIQMVKVTTNENIYLIYRFLHMKRELGTSFLGKRNVILNFLENYFQPKRFCSKIKIWTGQQMEVSQTKFVTS